jgi:hypothetical protein
MQARRLHHNHSGLAHNALGLVATRGNRGLSRIDKDSKR